MEKLGSKDLENEERKLGGGGLGKEIGGAGRSSRGRDLQIGRQKVAK